MWSLVRKRTPGWVAVAALTLALSVAGLARPAMADDDPAVPSTEEVAAAKTAVTAAADSVSAVQARLVVAQAGVEAAEIAAAQAGEAFNVARIEAHAAAKQARQAQRDADAANQDVATGREAYADAVNTSYRLGPSLSPLAALTQADGVSAVLQNATLIQHAEAALADTYETYNATALLARSAQGRADVALSEAEAAEASARQARDAAEAAAAAAADQAVSYAAERDQLIGELARLQDISVDLAEQRQDAMEQAAAEAAASAAQLAAEQAAAEAAAQPAAEGDSDSEEQAPAGDPTSTPSPDPSPDPAPGSPTPDPEPAPEPDPEPTPDPDPPAPSGGASAAISFARQQIGEPYKYGAAGPNSWDCSGLTMMAWRQGGVSLPHYSAGQYSAATPIKQGNLKAGDLLFWGSKPSSIYHVALYVGNGMMVHAPRSGRDVEEVSMYYWISPTYFARP